MFSYSMLELPEEYNLGHIEGSINIDFKNQKRFNLFFESWIKKTNISLL